MDEARILFPEKNKRLTLSQQRARATGVVLIHSVIWRARRFRLEVRRSIRKI